MSGKAVDSVKVAGVNPNSFLQLLSTEKSNTVLLAVVLVLNVNLFFHFNVSHTVHDRPGVQFCQRLGLRLAPKVVITRVQCGFTRGGVPPRYAVSVKFRRLLVELVV